MKYKFLFIVVVLYVLTIGIIFYINNMNNTEIVIFPNISFKYQSKKWKKNDFNSKINYNIYIKNSLLTKSKLTMKNDLMYYNNEILDDFIATSNDKTKIIDYNIETDEDNYKKVLEKLKISKYNNFKVNQKIVIDYDNDSELEEIYVLSNLFVDPFMEDVNDDKFSVLYTIDKGKTNIVYEKKFESDVTGCLLKIRGILDVNNDNKYELVTTCSYYDQLGTKIQIYELNKENYKLIKEL